MRTHPAALQYGWGRGKKVGYSERERETGREGEEDENKELAGT